MSKKRVFFIAAKEKAIFDALASGAKKVETRAATPKALLVQEGDIAVFLCAKERLERRVLKVSRFPSIDALLERYEPKEINPGVGNASELKAMYEAFPGYREKIAQYGIVAFELE
jgi:ASC-1-like (ASCH) protein